MKWSIAAAVFLCILGFGGAGWTDEVESVHVSLSTAYASRYMWRGITLNQDPVAQPSVNLESGGFTLNVWGSVDTTDWGEYAGYGDRTGRLTEADYTGLYSRKLLDKVNGSVGFVTYTYPHTGWDSTTEIYFLLGFDVPLSPVLSYSVDVDAAGGAGYYGLELSHEFKLGESGERGVGLDLSGHLAYANNKFIRSYFGLEFEEGGAWHDWSVGAALPCAVGYGITVTPSFLYTALWDEAIRREASKDNDEITADNEVFSVNVSWDLAF